MARQGETPPSGENVRCLMLPELVVDAGDTCLPGAKTPQTPPAADSLEGLVIRVAREMGVPQFHLHEIMQRVVAILGPEIDAAIRKELCKGARHQE